MDSERKPLLSHDAMVNLCEEGQLYPWQTEARKVRDFYEHLIAIGKLRVVEEVDSIGGQFDGFMCSLCRNEDSWFGPMDTKFCPGCGSSIKKNAR